MTNCTLTANDGGGLHCRDGASTVVLNNSIVALHADFDIVDEAGALSGSHSLIGNGCGQSSLLNGVNGNLVGTSLYPVDPMFVSSAYWNGTGYSKSTT